MLAQGLFALNSVVWVLILASRLDDQRFGQISALTALALFLAGIGRAWVAEPAFVGRFESRWTRRFGVLVASGAIATFAAPTIVGDPTSVAAPVVFGACAAATGWYEINRAEILSAGGTHRAIAGELVVLPALCTASLAVPTTASALTIASVVLAMTALGRLAFGRPIRTKASLPSVRHQVTYALDFVMAGGTFSAFLFISALVWSPDFAGELRLAQALAGPATTLMLAAWFAAQRLARDHGPESSVVSRLQIAVTTVAIGYAIGVVGLTLQAPGWEILPPTAIVAGVLGSRCCESLTLRPALLLRHTERPQRIIAARALTAGTLLVAVPMLLGSATVDARALGIAIAYAWPLPVWYWMSRPGATSRCGPERRAPDPAGTAD